MEQRKTVYGNQGQLVPDFYLHSISRAYLEDENLMIVLATSVGIETSTDKYANETARLIIPLSKVLEFNESISKATKYALQNTNSKNDKPIEDSKDKTKYILGESLGLF